MTTSKDELKQEQEGQQSANKEFPAENMRRPQRNIHHSLEELLKVAMDMGDQRVIDAIKKKIDE